MAEEGFLRRWSRLKSSGGEQVAAPVPAPAPAPAPVTAEAAPAPVAEPEARPPPTLDDVARLTPDADFSAFVAKGVDAAVRRLALKKMFSDPHFNAIDGLDMYMADYNQAAPLPPDMLASLRHAPGVLSRLLVDAPEEQDDPEAPALAEQPAEQPPSTRQGNA